MHADDPEYRQIATFMEEWLAEIGIEVETTPSDDIGGILDSGEFDLLFTGWTVNPDPDYIFSIHTCGVRPAEPGASYQSDTYNCDATYDQLYAQQRAEVDPEARAEIVKQMQKVLYEDGVVVIFGYPDMLEAYRTDVVEEDSPMTQPAENGNIDGQDGYWGWWSAEPASGGGGGGDDDSVGAVVLGVGAGSWSWGCRRLPGDAASLGHRGRPRVGSAESQQAGPVRRRAAARRSPVPAGGRVHRVLPVPGAARRPGPHDDPDQTVSRPSSRRSAPQFGLDQPLWQQFSTTSGSWRSSTSARRTSTEDPAGRRADRREAGPTMLLVGTATVISAVLGLWLGIRTALAARQCRDRVNTGVALTLWSVPTFWLGLLLIIVFAAGVGPIPGIFPTGGMRDPATSTGSGADPRRRDHLVLPVVTLVAVVYAQYLLVMRSSLLDEMGSDYLTTARAKGLRDDVVRRRHAVPNALLPDGDPDLHQPRRHASPARSWSRRCSPGPGSASCSTRR